MQWEYKTELDRAYSLETGGHELCLRVQYRRPGTRRWSSFLLFGDALPEASSEVVLAAIAQHAGRGKAVTR